jgi:hypothetical protein
MERKNHATARIRPEPTPRVRAGRAPPRGAVHREIDGNGSNTRRRVCRNFVFLKRMDFVSSSHTATRAAMTR